MGLAGILATVGMLFAAFTAALLMRRMGADWAPVHLPPIVWVNTAVLLLSSVAVELARRAVVGEQLGDAVMWLGTATVLGALFLAGQVAAWRSLAAHQVLLSNHVHAAFFYVLSAVHGMHVVGGLGALGWTAARARRGAYSATRPGGLKHTAIYWHVVGGVWLYLLLLLTTL